MDELKKSGKTVDEAVSEALKELNVLKDDVEITVLEEGAKGFLGVFGSKDAVVLVKLKFNPERVAVQFLKEMFQSMGIIVEITAKIKDKQMFIELAGDDMGILIGKRGQTLDALQYLVSLVVNKGNAPYISILMDTENYRQRRKEILENLAYNLSKKVKQTKKSVMLEPMNPYERRIIHSSLQHDKLVTTYSQGEDPYRNVVIALK